MRYDEIQGEIRIDLLLREALGPTLSYSAVVIKVMRVILLLKEAKGYLWQMIFDLGLPQASFAAVLVVFKDSPMEYGKFLF